MTWSVCVGEKETAMRVPLISLGFCFNVPLPCHSEDLEALIPAIFLFDADLSLFLQRGHIGVAYN